jgi:hypothetical protein
MVADDETSSRLFPQEELKRLTEVMVRGSRERGFDASLLEGVDYAESVLQKNAATVQGGGKDEAPAVSDNKESPATDDAQVTAEEQGWFDYLWGDKAGAERQAKVKLWKGMSHQERKEFYEEIRAVRKGGK